jgi:hypothetical protein
MSAVATYNFEIPQGATWIQVINWKTGTPPAFVNTAGFSAKCQFRSSHASSTIVMELSTANTRISMTNAGVITLSLTAALTAGIPATRYVYDLEMISAGGVVTRLLEGHVTVTPEVTR